MGSFAIDRLCRCSVNCSNDGNIDSFHPGGVLASFCDGHVRFLRQTLSPVTLAWLVAANDGQMVGESDF